MLIAKRGEWHLALEHLAPALADFDAAASLGYESLDVRTGRGVALRGLGDYAASLAALTEAVDRYPTAVVARYQRAILRIVNGERAAALTDLDWIIEYGAVHPKPPEAYSLRAAIRAEDGDHALVVADTEQAIARHRGPAPTEWMEFLADARAKQPKGEHGA